MLRRAPGSTLFPYTTLFRSEWATWPRRRASTSASIVRGETTRSTSHIEESRRRRSEEHTSELQSRRDLVCRLLLEKKKPTYKRERSTERRMPAPSPRPTRDH